MLSLLKSTLQQLKADANIAAKTFKQAQSIYFEEGCTMLTQSLYRYDFVVETKEKEQELALVLEEERVYPLINNKPAEWDEACIAALLELTEKMSALDPSRFLSGRRYTREGMKHRVIAERKQKAADANYHIVWADNIYGEHILKNEEDVEYRLTLRDFEKEIGYVDSADLRTNKLGTTKHLMWAFQQLKSNKRLYNKLDKTYPFVEIYLDPLNEYKISWFYPHDLNKEIQKMIYAHFGEGTALAEQKTLDFLRFIQAAAAYEEILIRPEVKRKVEAAYNQEMLADIRRKFRPDFSPIKAELFDYQKEGVEFALFREGAIIADEMGLGKTLQAITIAVFKKQLFDFKRVLIICPASLKAQWKKEIEKFTSEEALVVEGKPFQRAATYRDSEAYFLIVNYETILRDGLEINKYPPDFIILDEAQRIKNFQTKTAQSVKRLKRKHNLIITGTPIENKLIDLFSVVQFVDAEFLAPLWEFSYQHCYFDESSKDRITGYYNLQNLKKRMKEILIRREKRNVIKQLPNLREIDVPVNMHPQQADYHASYAKGIAQILRKKFKTPYDWQRLMLLLSNMRMVCDSTNLIDKETNYSPKLSELRRVLIQKLDLPNNSRKVIIFSEWVRMHHLIGEVLKELGLGYVELSGKIPVKKRGKLIKQFEEDDTCRVFLSTEAGGAGLNLQMADVVINFELPWNPAKKNQRIGRIDRLGQTSKSLTVINFITRNSIEEKIATGLMLKQNLFEGVLDSDDETDVVDFSAHGKGQFLKELESQMLAFEEPVVDELVEEEAEVIVEPETVSDELVEPKESDEKQLEPKPQRRPRGNSSYQVEPSPTSTSQPEVSTALSSSTTSDQQVQLEQMEEVMNQGLQFLSGLYKLSTGKDMDAKNSKVEVDKETGEVVMRFKMF